MLIAVCCSYMWDIGGKKIGQWLSSGKKLAQGQSTGDTAGYSISIQHEHKNDGAQPHYLLLNAADDDAICISQVTVSGNGANWVWMGDIARTCGADWYHSNNIIGSGTYMPSCGWLDKDHSNGLSYVAYWMHMPDFNGAKGLLDEYQAHKENLCGSRARFSLIKSWSTNKKYNAEKFLETYKPKFFDPPLKYNEDGSDDAGPKGDFAPLFAPGKTRAKRNDDETELSLNTTAASKVFRPGHVVISEHAAHGAVELCESESSRGPSFVSMEEKVYCDMSTKTRYPLCSSTVTSVCFDVDTKQLLGKPRRHARDLNARDVQKQYVTHEVWRRAR